MRTAALVLLGLGLALAGGTCLPLVDNTSREPRQGTKLIVALTSPDAARTVRQGDTVAIAWTFSNLTGGSGNVTVVAESRTNLARTTLTSGAASTTSGRGAYTWDTAGFDGPYAIIATISGGGLEYSTTSVGLVTVDAPPKFAFEAPTEDVEFTPGESDELAIRYTGSDNESGKVKLGLDVDTNHRNENEIIINEEDLPTKPEQKTFYWNGKSKSGEIVAEETYYLFARLEDARNDPTFVDAVARIKVLEAPGTGAAVTKPDEDTNFLTTDATFRIEYRIDDEDNDVLVDVKIDTDDSHANGNEITILSQQFVAKDTEPPPFDWDGNDTHDPPAAVPTGIYRPFIVISRETGNPQTIRADGLIFRRDTENQPLIGLIEPTSVRTLNPGEYLLIKWRDDDPDGDADEAQSAKIKIVIDADGDPATTGDQKVILTDRNAAGDGVRDTFQWSVNATGLDLGKMYYIIAYIDKDGVDPPDSWSVAGGRLIIRDPTNP